MLPIEETRIVQGEGAWLSFSDTIELDPPLAYATIQSEVEADRLSEVMGQCGQEGFNMAQIKDQDIRRIRDFSSPRGTTWAELL